jgi:uncharacterized membrane protein
MLGLLVAVIAVVVVVLTGHAVLAPSTGWICGSVTYLLLTWMALWPLNAKETAGHATREDPTRPASDAVVLLASIVGLGAVVLLIADPGAGGKFVAAVFGVGVVAASWFVVHTLYTLRYAAEYYRGKPGGVEFSGDDAPDYADFAYLAFTLGMTYQVSDQALSGRGVRRIALRHALLSYLLGAVVIGITINLVGGLA